MKTSPNRLQGHEFTGTVEEVGSEVKNFTKGDQIVSPFTISWWAQSQRCVTLCVTDVFQWGVFLLQERLLVKMFQGTTLWHSGS